MNQVKTRSVRWGRWVLGAIVIALVALHVVNHRRIDASGLAAAIEPVIERARENEARARPEYQDHALATLPPSTVNGAFYLLDDHLGEAKVAQAPTLPEGGEGAVLDALEFNDAKDSGLVSPSNDIEQHLENGVLRLYKKAGGVYLTNKKPITARRDDIGDIVIRMKASKQTRLTLGWSTEPHPENPFKHQFDMAVEGSDKLETYVINARDVLRRGLGPDDAPAHIFIRPAYVEGADVEIDYIRFISRTALYMSAINGITDEEVGGELRPSLYMLTDQSLLWSVDIPKEAPALDLGQALRVDKNPVHFSVTVEEGGAAKTVDEATIASSASWRDVSIDLRPWAGKRVTLGLHAKAPMPKAVALWSNPRIRSAAKRRFNVIVILEDALRADYLSLYGHERDTSPNKTRIMAKQGIVFEHAFTQAEKTRPSVPAIFTGLLPTSTGVWHFSDVLSDRYLTLAEIMRSQGFVTASFIQNGNAGPYAGLAQGFDYLRERELTGKITDDVLGKRSLEWIRAHANQNFFLYLHAIDPHGPYDPQAPFDDWYRAEMGKGDRLEVGSRFEPEGMKSVTDRERRARYEGEIRTNDAAVPAFLDELRALNLIDDTLVIFLSDHGEFMGERGLWEHRPPGLTPVLHVQMMMLYPRRFAEPRRIAENVQLIDVLPTILDISGIDRSGLLLQGDSLVDLIEQRNMPHWRDRLVVSEEPTAMIRDNACVCGSLIYRNWHLVASTWTWPGGPLVTWFPKLQASVKLRAFDFHEDPKEEGLYWSFLPDVHLRWIQYRAASQLHELDGSFHDKITANEKGGKNIDPGVLENLRGLGYIN